MKYLPLLLSILIITSCSNKQSETIDISEEWYEPRSYVVGKTESDIRIDGLDNEKDWDKAKYSELFIDIEGEKIPKYETKVKMLWDNQFLYVFAKMEEPHVWGDITKRDAVIYYNNDFEVFIDPSNTGTHYGEIEINALNTVWDLLLTKPYRVGGRAVFNWNLNDLKTAVNIDGTLNNPLDEDKCWSVEMAIPLKAFLELRGKPNYLPKEGEQWRINFSRVEWDYEIIDGIYQRKKMDGKYLSEYNWVWSPQKVINMHEPEKWGYLQFHQDLNLEDVKYNRDPNLDYKQVLFSLFRKTRYGDLNELNSNNAGFKKEFNVNFAKSQKINVLFFKTNQGFEFQICKGNNGKKLIINQEGFLKEI